MTSPIQLYGQGYTPNPIKVAIILEELGIEYTVEKVEDKKSEWYTKLNPNGRVPSIKDPNTGVTMFESGACIEYLISNYDKDNKLQYTTSPEKWLTKSWLHIQTSGQGPYFGQQAWFQYLHHEKLPSAIERYSNEIKRLTGVINSHLKTQGTQYLIGDKVTYADLAFVPWAEVAETALMRDWDFKSEFPEFAAWYQSLKDRPAVKRTYGKKEFQRSHVET